MSTNRSPLSDWICDSLRNRPAEPKESEAAPSSEDVPSAVTESGVVRKYQGERPLEALSRRPSSEPPPPSSTLPLGYRRSRSSGARVLLGITQNPWKKRA